MKKFLMIPIVIMLLAGSAFATTIYYPDRTINWPGYPKAPYPINPNDQIGSYPTVKGAAVTFNESNYLDQIAFDLTNMRWDTTLFINTKTTGGTPYDQWDYFVRVRSLLDAKFYTVSPTFTPVDYILVSLPSWRVGHPYSIDPSKLTLTPGYLSGVTVTPTQLVFDFVPGMIELFGRGENFVIGLSQDCGNDVFLTPEPGTLLLLGAGILGLGIVIRRRRK